VRALLEPIAWVAVRVIHWREIIAWTLVHWGARIYPPLIGEIVRMTVGTMANLPLDNDATGVNLDASRRDS
jgi:hypothetical protein